MTFFGLGRPRPEQVERRQIETWAREASGLADAVVVKVNEIVCADPTCPGFETVILIMPPGERSLVRKIMKPLAEVTQSDVTAAVCAGS